MNTKIRQYALSVLILLALVVSGCSSPQVKLNISTTANLNMNSKKEPLPVVIRIYQLTDPKTFQAATFNELWKSDLAVLGNTLLRKDSLTLDPASQHHLDLDRHEQTKYVAIMAAFNNQSDDTWRTVKETDGSLMGMDVSTKLTVSLKNNVIEIVE